MKVAMEDFCIYYANHVFISLVDINPYQLENNNIY